MIVGLTGGIGSGKTTVGDFFVELGVPVYNSDLEAKQLMISSKLLKKDIKKLLGKDAYKDKKLNKTYISDKIFNDPSLLQKMNNIVHPAVRDDFMVWAKMQNSPYVIQETALIFENSAHEFYDKIILVTVPQDTRIQRVVDRDGSSKKKISERIDNQLSDAEKIPFADFVIANSELEKTKLKVEEINIALLEYC